MYKFFMNQSPVVVITYFSLYVEALRKASAQYTPLPLIAFLGCMRWNVFALMTERKHLALVFSYLLNYESTNSSSKQKSFVCSIY